MFLLKPSNWKFGAISPTSGAKSKAIAESELNKKIKDKLINLNDYIEIINNDLITYVILCDINFDKDLLNNININKKINKTVDDLEKSFINRYSIKYNLIIYNE